MVDVRTSNVIFIFVKFLKSCRFPLEFRYHFPFRLCTLGPKENEEQFFESVRRTIKGTVYRAMLLHFERRTALEPSL